MKTIMFPSYLFILLLCSCAVLNNANVDPECNVQEPFFAAQIVLLPDPLDSRTFGVKMRLFHNLPNFQVGDKLILVESDDLNKTQILHEIPISDRYYTHVIDLKTTKMFIQAAINSKLNISSDIESSSYRVYSAYFQRGELKSKTFKLRTHENWMYEQKNILRNRPLSSVILPGTHQSGSYKMRTETVNRQTVSTQAMTILEQLVFGVRYLDIVYGEFDTGDFWCYSGDRLMLRMQELIDQVKDFMDRTNEIVIMGFRSRNGERNIGSLFTLPNLLTRQFKGYLFPREAKAFSTTLGEIWDSGKRLIITYDFVSEENTDLWYKIPHHQRTVAYQNIYLYISNAERETNPKAVMLNYVTDSEEQSSYSLSSRDIAIDIKGSMIKEYNQKYQLSANIIAVDYIETSGMVDFAIYWNRWRNGGCTQSYIDSSRQE